MRFLRLWGTFLMMSVLLAACSGGGTAASVQEETSADTQAAGSGSADDSATTQEEVAEDEDEPEPFDKRQAIMADGVLYIDTGYNSSVVGCGVMDGNIEGTVPGTEYPVKDNHTNFEGATGWQVGYEPGTVHVYMNDRARIFAAEGTYAKEQIPAAVGNMMGTVVSIRGDGYFVFRPTSMPEAFSHLAPDGEYLVPVSAMENDPAFPAKDGEVNWSLVAGGVVMVYCDTVTAEANPPALENVYHVFRVGSSPVLHAGNPIQRKLDELLAGLEWSEETCDGIPEYIYYAEDGTAYQINLSDDWIWREWKEEAPITEVHSLILEYVETYGLDEFEG